MGPGGREAPGAGDRRGESRQRHMAPPPRQHKQPNQETNLRLQSFNLLASQIHSSPGNQARHSAI